MMRSLRWGHQVNYEINIRTEEKDEDAIKAVFGEVEYVDSDLNEKAFVTAVITEGKFETCCNKIGVKSALRVLD